MSKNETVTNKEVDEKVTTNDLDIIIRPLDVAHHKSILDKANIKIKNVNVKIRVKKGEKFTLDVKKESTVAEEA